MYFRQTWSSVMLIYVKETLALLYILNRFSILLVPPTAPTLPYKIIEVLFPSHGITEFQERWICWGLNGGPRWISRYGVVRWFRKRYIILENHSRGNSLGFLNPCMENLIHCFSCTLKRGKKKKFMDRKHSKDDRFWWKNRKIYDVINILK